MHAFAKMRGLALGLMILVACQPLDGEGETPETTQEPHGARIELSTWAEDDFEVQAWKELVARFEQEFGIAVELEIVTPEIDLEAR